MRITRMMSKMMSAAALVPLAAALAATPAIAQDQTFRLNIPSMDLGDALRTFGRATRQQVVFSGGVVRGQRSNAIDGNYSAREALARMIAGSGLSIRVGNGGIFMVMPEGNGDAASLDLQAEGAATDEGSTGEPIFVTGSRIPNVAPTSPLVVLDETDFRQSGVSNIEDAVRNIPQNFAGLTAANSVNSDESLGTISLGNSGINLRGLGSDATLVLINGRRTAGSASLNGEAVNINTIPLSAVERIEILTDGASAIYGSDAIGGVVNIILKRERGLSATAHFRYEDSSTSGHSYTADQSLSVGWRTGAANASVSFRHTSAVDAADIGFTTFDFRDRGGFDQRFVRSGQPGTIDLSFNEFFALPRTNNGLNFSAADLIPAYVTNPATGGRLLDAVGNPVINPDFPAATRAEFLQISPETENLGVRLGVEQNVGSHVRLFADLLYSENESTVVFGVPRIEANVPATNAFNDLGRRVFVSYRPFLEVANGVIPLDTGRNRQHGLDLSGGVQLSSIWGDWGAAFTVTRATDNQQFTRTTLNTTSARLAPILASSDPAQSLNLFGNGTAQNNAVLASLVVNDQAQELSVRLHGYDLSLNGSLFNLPGGDVRTSFGAEYRRERLRSLGAVSVRKVSAAYGELAVPVFGEELTFPGMESLLLIGAARYEDYVLDGDFNNNGQADDDSRTFNRLSPRVGVRWKPFSDLTILGNWSRSFRAPTSTSLFGTPVPFPAGIFALTDPLAPGGPTIVRPALLFVANPALRPETSTSWTAEANWQPASLPGLRVSVGYNHTDFTDRLSTGLTALLRNSAAILGDLNLIPGYSVVRDAAGNITSVSVPRQVNAASRTSETFDFSASYEWQTDHLGNFNIGISGVRTLDVREQAFVGSPIVQLSGTTQGPSAWVGYATVGWQYAQFETNLFVRHSSSYTNEFFNRTVEGRQPEPVDGYTTVDLSVSYAFNSDSRALSGLRITVGARNLFDADFPFVDNVSGPFDPTRVDVRGRIVYFDITKTFR